VFASCPADVLRRYPFLLSSAWVAVAGVFLWLYAYRFMDVKDEVPSCSDAGGGIKKDPAGAGAGASRVGAGAAGKGVEMAKIAGGGRRNGEGDRGGDEDREDLHPAAAPRRAASDGSDDSGAVVVEVSDSGSGGGAVGKKCIDEEEDDDDDEGEEVLLLSPAEKGGGVDEEKGLGGGFAPISLLSDGDSPQDEAAEESQRERENTGSGSGAGGSLSLPWHKDPTVKQAIVNQVGCTFIILTGAELTPIWMATTRANGGLGFTAVGLCTLNSFDP
jgi:hypothetical protein